MVTNKNNQVKTEVKLLRGIQGNSKVGYYIMLENPDSSVACKEWNGDTIFQPCLIDLVFKDIELDGEKTNIAKKAAAATKEYCLKWFQGWIECLDNDNDVTVYDIEQKAFTFFDGYLAAITGEIKAH